MMDAASIRLKCKGQESNLSPCVCVCVGGCMSGCCGLWSLLLSENCLIPGCAWQPGTGIPQPCRCPDESAPGHAEARASHPPPPSAVSQLVPAPPEKSDPISHRDCLPHHELLPKYIPGRRCCCFGPDWAALSRAVFVSERRECACPGPSSRGHIPGMTGSGMQNTAFEAIP